MGDVLLHASSLDHIYTNPGSTQPASIPANVALTESTDVWHHRLGYCGASVLDTLQKNSLVYFKSVFSNTYMTCYVAKSHRLPFTLAEHETNSPLQLIHSNVLQSPICSHHGCKYYVSFINDYSRFTWIYPMKQKYKIYGLFITFQNLVENLINYKIRMFQSDGGREFDNSDMLDLFYKSGVYFRKSCPNAQQQNRVAERKHHNILKMVHTFLIDASMLAYFRFKVAPSIVYTNNRLPSSVLCNKTPFEALFYRVPDYAILKPFGCAHLPNLMASSANKLQP